MLRWAGHLGLCVSLTSVSAWEVDLTGLAASAWPSHDPFGLSKAVECLTGEVVEAESLAVQLDSGRCGTLLQEYHCFRLTWQVVDFLDLAVLVSVSLCRFSIEESRPRRLALESLVALLLVLADAAVLVSVYRFAHPFYLLPPPRSSKTSEPERWK